jgi:hypothetical protein
MIGVAHRTGPPTSSNRGIIVRFLRKQDKEDFLQARRVKRDLKVGALDCFADLRGPAAEVIVFVNESLSPARRDLLNKARLAKKDGKLSDVWTVGGKVFVRKTTEGMKHTVRDLDHLLAIAQ